jgi:hypothetical protein
MVQEATPGPVIPLPMPLAAWSPAPPTTGVPSFRPVALAAALLTAPVISTDSFRSGRSVISRFSLSTISRDQRRRTTSSKPVPEASETSVQYSPVSL